MSVILHPKDVYCIKLFHPDALNPLKINAIFYLVALSQQMIDIN